MAPEGARKLARRGGSPRSCRERSAKGVASTVPASGAERQPPHGSTRHDRRSLDSGCLVAAKELRRQAQRGSGLFGSVRSVMMPLMLGAALLYFFFKNSRGMGGLGGGGDLMAEMPYGGLGGGGLGGGGLGGGGLGGGGLGGGGGGGLGGGGDGRLKSRKSPFQSTGLRDGLLRDVSEAPCGS